MITQINHIGIAVKNLEEHIPIYRDILGLKLITIEEVEEQKVRTAIFETGGVHIELLQPTADDSPIAKFLQKKGEGMHHIAFQSNDLSLELEALKAKGIQQIDQKPREGAHDTKIAFLHPKSTGNVLMELCEVHEKDNFHIHSPLSGGADK